MKHKLKNNRLIRKNYRIIRKIFLHLIHGRFFFAARLANHYNPFYRLLLLTPYRLNRIQAKNFRKVMRDMFAYVDDPKKTIQVGLVMEDADLSPKSSAFIRLISPLTHPSISSRVNIRLIASRNAKTNPETSVYIVQRTAFTNLKKAQNFYKAMEKYDAKLIIDNDDSFSSIPKTHPEYKKHKRMLAAKNYLLKQADEIWLSTESLISPEHKAKSIVVKNSLDDRVWLSPKQKTTSGKIEMICMGTATHDEDFQMILPALDAVYEQFPDSFRLTTIGVSSDVPARPWIRQLTQPRFGSLYPSFVKWFLSLEQFDIGLSPLVDDGFNQAKSDIKCLDYLAAEILPVVSDVLPYQSAEIQPYIKKVKNHKSNWQQELSKIVTGPDQFRSEKANIIPKAQKYIWQKRSSQTTARILLQRIQKLSADK